MPLNIFLLALVILGAVLCFIYCIVTGICPCSSTRKSRRAIISSIPPETGGTIYELGAGWGALAFPLARRCPHARIIAYELSPVPWLFMRLFRILGPRNLEIHRKNFLKASLRDATYVVCYLHPQALKKLEPKLRSELSPGAVVISNTFELPCWQPALVETLEDLMCPEIFFYQAVRFRSPGEPEVRKKKVRPLP